MAVPWRLNAADAAGFRLLLKLAVIYGAMSLVVHGVINMRHVVPLAADAPPDVFSEARAIEHIRRLSVDIDGRQEGRPGLEQAAQYIKEQLEEIAARAGSEFRIEIEETLVNGSFNLTFLQHKATFGYRNHKNIVMRVSSNVSEDDDLSFLLNGHYDSALNSPGAADCGSCVASMLELARVLVDSKWIPPRPIIFLFNGAEELFLLGSHGFLMTHKWSKSIGAFIDLEASGSGGPDLVVQSGPGSWPSNVYAQNAKYPAANSIAQDLFQIIPGDTDYRIFAEDYGNIPGLDIIFVLGGYFYHTSYDTVENLIPGSIQARGENVLRLLKAFAKSSMLQNPNERLNAIAARRKDMRPVFFDYLTWFEVIYPYNISVVLHSLPLVVYLLVPFALCFPNITLKSWFFTALDLVKGTLFHAFAVSFAIFLPIVVAVLRLVLVKQPMSWFAQPYLAYMMFVPSSLLGLLLPRRLLRISEEACFWGAFGLYALITMAYVLVGLNGGFVTFLILTSMLLGKLCYHYLGKGLKNQALMYFFTYFVPLMPGILYCLYYGGFLIQFLIEKMGMSGSLPQPYGYYVPDIIVAAIVGLVTGWGMGPVVPIAGRWLARSSVLHVLLQVIVVAMALSSQFFPYSVNAPKRVVLQHTFVSSDVDNIEETSLNFFVVDANSLNFTFDNSPEVAKWLLDNTESPVEEGYGSTWAALYPVSSLFYKSRKFPVPRHEIRKPYEFLPLLFLNGPITTSDNGHRRVPLELYLGSLSEIWVSVVNITGPLSNWSFAGGMLPAAQTMRGGPPSYVCRLSGKSSENWTFWLEASSSEPLRVDVAVLDQHLVDGTKELKSLFPEWADVIAFNSFFSTYQF